MAGLWASAGLVLLVAVTHAEGAVSDELHFQAPPLFALEDYERCLARASVYCMGEFQLRPDHPSTSKLYDDLLEASSERLVLNRTLLHRGVCVTSCVASESEPAAQFEQCVDQRVRAEYGLRARLNNLLYCKSDGERSRPVDYIDVFMAAIIILVVALNVAGTFYDFTRSPDDKSMNRFLLAWSLRVNWRRLTAQHAGDERLDALQPIHGVKAHQSVLVVMAHTLCGMLVVYQQDPRKVDLRYASPETPFLRNGTLVLQTFATLTSFLLAYMLLLHADNTKKPLSLRNVPAIILNRYMRMTPTVMFVVGVTATWVARAGDGPMWVLVQQLEADCRAKWWTHLFYLNNVVNQDQRCLIQTWFLAVDMQLFLVAVVLTLALLPQPHRAPRRLAALYVLVLAVNLALNVKWQMVPMSHLSTPENLRNFYVNLESYNWMFSMPWTSLPACLHGLMLAFLHYNLQKGGYKPAEHKWTRVAVLAAIPVTLTWLVLSSWMGDVTSPLLLSLTATFDRTIFNAMITFILWTLINKLFGVVNEYMSWRGFPVVSRIALSMALVHWHVNLAGVAALAQPLEATQYYFLSLWISGVVLTLLLALPLHLMVELPSQKIVDLFM